MIPLPFTGRMNLDTVISKLETIASRIFDPIHIGGWDSIFEGEPLYLLYPVKEIWVFGSAVYVDDPRDLDIYVVSGTNSKIIHDQFCDERRKAPTEYWRWYGYHKLAKKTLLKKMKNVDIHFDIPITVSDLRILVWSHEKTNIRENFLTGRENVDLAPECRSLRKQLKTATAKNYVLDRLCRMFRNMENHIRRWNHIPSRSNATQEELYEIRTLRKLNEYFRKEDLPRLKLFFEGHGRGGWNYIDYDLIKKFIEIKEQKGSKRIFEQLGWKKHEQAHSKRVRDFQRT